MTSSPSLQIIPPALKFLEDFANKQANGYLRCTANGVTWYVYLSKGKIFHVNFSIDPLERLELYTRRIVGSRNFDWRIVDVWRQRVAIAKLDDFYPSYDYQSIHSLVRKNKLTASEGVEIIKGITTEAFRNLLLVDQLECNFVQDNREFPILWSINFLSLAKECQDEIQRWQALGSGISSPYQRLFVVRKQEPTLQLDAVKQFLTGVDFHQLALSLQKSPLEVAQQLRPLIDRGLVGLRTPKVPFNKLPHFAERQDSNSFDTNVSTRLQYRVVCIDDSPTILQRMRLFLDNKVFEIFSILDSGTALTQITTIKPHVILLDITVTSNTGFFDRTRAKLCGATDYLPKPFTQASLSEMVFKYIGE
jgi:two-component system, chemotaxis family, response regulator PixG